VFFIPSNVVQLAHTATDDLKFALVYSDMWFREINIHILTNDARYGDTNITSSNPSITAGNGISFQDVNLKDIFFINSAGGSNTTIFAVGVLMTPGRKTELGVD
jgi:hypothetical protein